MKTKEKILKWAESKGIFQKSNILKQLQKTQEELTELRDEVVIISNARIMREKRRREALVELGDVLVTLRIVAQMLGTEFEECEVKAFTKISKREGEMVDGLFEKSGDN